MDSRGQALVHLSAYRRAARLSGHKGGIQFSTTWLELIFPTGLNAIEDILRGQLSKRFRGLVNVRARW